MLRKPALGIWKSRDKGKEGTAGLKATTLLAPDFHWYLRRSHLYRPSLSHQRLQFKSAILPCVCCKEATRHQEVAWITTPEGWQQREELLQCPIQPFLLPGLNYEVQQRVRKTLACSDTCSSLGKTIGLLCKAKHTGGRQAVRVNKQWVGWHTDVITGSGKWRQKEQGQLWLHRAFQASLCYKWLHFKNCV